MDEKFSLKDHLFNPSKIAQLATEISAVYPDFAQAAFQTEVVAAFPALELKARIGHIRQCLRAYLPADYRAAVTILLKALPAPLDPSKTDDDFGDFIYAPYSDFIAQYGCNADDLSFSLAALKEITMRFSAEDAIRYFINAFPQETLETLMRWTQDEHYHVRRLCSEGSRPKLPWSQKLNLAPDAALPLLHLLFADSTRYVTRSVANHLNDLAKTHPDLVCITLSEWQKSRRQKPAEMGFMLKHALRTLIKAGHPKALSLLGFGAADGVSITTLKHTKQVRIGDALQFSFCISVNENKPLTIDYVLHFQSKQGARSNKKVYKLQTIQAQADESAYIAKSHPLRANMTTRPLYAGGHKVEIQVNGSILASFSFDLTEP